MDCDFRSDVCDDVSNKLNVTYNLLSSFISFVFGVFFFGGRELMAAINGKQIY